MLLHNPTRFNIDVINATTHQCVFLLFTRSSQLFDILLTYGGHWYLPIDIRPFRHLSVLSNQWLANPCRAHHTHGDKPYRAFAGYHQIIFIIGSYPIGNDKRRATLLHNVGKITQHYTNVGFSAFRLKIEHLRMM